jgi:serine/threonine protein kinase
MKDLKQAEPTKKASRDTVPEQPTTSVNSVLVKNQYQLVRKLGAGSHGVVFMFLHSKSIQRSPLVCNEDRSKTLERLKPDENPHVLTIIDSFEWDEYLYMVTEYCEGGSLEEWLKKHKKISEE